MKEPIKGKSLRRLRRATLAIIASGIVAATSVHANPSNNIVLVSPTELPDSARQTGEAMLLRDTVDGRSLLYVEQNQGAQLTIFDVTDPVHITNDGSVRLGAAGPFDFVSPLGGKKELVRFRQSHAEAVLDLHKATLPSLKTVQGPSLQGPITRLGNDGFTVTDQATTDTQPLRDYQVVDTSSLRDLNRVFDVKQVREEVTKQDTGTTFLLTDSGLYVIRRPVAESDKRRRDRDRELEYAGS